MISRHPRLFRVLLVLIFLIGTLVLSRHRPLDGDEGYYASAARLVSEGQTPYLDFFYPQMPLMPYLYAPFYRLVGSSLVDMRLLSVFLGAISLMLWGSLLRRRWPERPVLVLAAMALVAMNPYFLSWNVTTKTYALANLAVFTTLWALDRGLRSRRLPWFFLAGAAAGLCVGVRLLYLPWAGSLALVLVGLQMGNMDKKLRLGRAFTYLGGWAAGLAPSAVFFFLDSEKFLFNNLLYHQLRFSTLAKSGAGGAARVAAAFQGLGGALFLNPFMVFQLVLAGLGIDWVRRHPDSQWRPLMILSGCGAVVHTVACLFPDPVYEQYFIGPLTPLLAPLVIAGLARLMEMTKRPGSILAAVLILAAALSTFDLQVRKTGMNWEEVWSFGHLAKVSGAIEARTEPDDMVMAFWPGYVFETGRQYLPGLENQFALGVSEKLTLDQKVAYHVAGKELILKALDYQYADVVVLGAWMHELNTTIDQTDLPIILQELDTKYQLKEYFGETKIMIRKPVPGSEVSTP